jgi:tRNA modification GTPase
MQTHHQSDTIVALSTGQGIAAISMIRLSGTKAFEITDKVFKGDVLKDAVPHTLHYGRIENEQGEHLDDVVIGVYRAPKSYTTEDLIEISCHGSPFIVKEILELLIRHGARPADPGEFTMRAFLNGRMDLSQAEAVADLIESQTKASHRIAVQQLRGGVSTEIQVLRQKLLDFVSLIELELDFSEEDVEFADRDKLNALVWEVIRMIALLKKTFELGNAIKTGIPTVIAGRPNAGKSTLLNKLLKEERAIVSAIPGTTRDTIEEALIINGIQYRLIDTAGIREAHDEIEAIGIARTMEKIEQASILIYVFDVTSTTPSDVLRDMGVIQPAHAKVILAANKMDLSPYTDPGSYAIDGMTVVPMSAVKSMNIPFLIDTLAELVRKDIPDNATIISSARHYHALDRAQVRLLAVVEGLEKGVTHDFLAQDIRQAMYHLSEITGDISTEDVLGNIFGRFCIGK